MTRLTKSKPVSTPITPPEPKQESEPSGDDDGLNNLFSDDSHDESNSEESNSEESNSEESNSEESNSEESNSEESNSEESNSEESNSDEVSRILGRQRKEKEKEREQTRKEQEIKLKFINEFTEPTTEPQRKVALECTLRLLQNLDKLKSVDAETANYLKQISGIAKVIAKKAS